MTEDATPTPCIAPRAARQTPAAARAGRLGRALALTGLVLLGAPAPAAAQTVRAVTEATTYTYLRDGRVSGPATQLVETALHNAGIDHQINLYPWARAYDMAAKEPNVLIFLIARTPAREPLFKWAGEFMTIRYHLYKLKERQDIVVKTLEDARQYSTGVLRDDVRHQYLLSKGFTKLVVSSENLDNFRRLVNGQVQLVPMPESDVAQACAQTAVDCNRLERVYTLDEITSSVYMAYSRSTPDAIVKRTRVAFDKLKADGAVKKAMEGP